MEESKRVKQVRIKMELGAPFSGKLGCPGLFKCHLCQTAAAQCELSTFKAFGPAVEKSWLLNSWFLLRDEGNCTRNVSCKVAINQIPPVRIVVVPLPWDGTYGLPRALATTDWAFPPQKIHGFMVPFPIETKRPRISSILQGNLAFHGLFWSSISLQQTTQRLGRCYLDRFICSEIRARGSVLCQEL